MSTNPHPEVSDLSVRFTQGADCCSTEDQEIEIRVADGGGGPFVVLKTERWAVDTPEEIAALVSRVLQIVGAAK